MNPLSTQDLAISAEALEKLAELIGNVEDDIQGIRVYATPGGCSGMNFGMTFTDSINDDDLVGIHGEVRVVVDSNAIDHLRGAEIDFVDRGDGNAAFVFNNIPRATGGGCGSGSCGGGGCA